MPSRVLIAPVAFNTALSQTHLFQRIEYPDLLAAIDDKKLPGIKVNLPYHPFRLVVTPEFFTARSKEVPALFAPGGTIVELGVNFVSQYSPAITGVVVGPGDRDFYDDVASEIFAACFSAELEIELCPSDSDGFKVTLCHYREVIDDLSEFIDVFESRREIIERRLP